MFCSAPSFKQYWAFFKQYRDYYIFNYKPKFDWAYSKDNVCRMKDGAHIINLDDKKSKETHWILLFIDGNTTMDSDSFEYEYIPWEVLRKINGKSITHNMFKIQSDDPWCAAIITLLL